MPTVQPVDPLGVRPPDVAAELVLVRHGQGECNAAGVIGGPTACRGLSEQGRRESAMLAERLSAMHATRPFHVLLSSPRPRVLECARIIGARLALPVTVVDALRGQDFGAADGRVWEHVIREFGGPPTHDPDRPIADGAESWNAYAERVLSALHAILVEYAGQRVLLVGHGKTTGLAGALLSGVAEPRSRAPEYVLRHGALSSWRRDSGEWHLFVHDDARHLATATGHVGPPANANPGRYRAKHIPAMSLPGPAGLPSAWGRQATSGGVMLSDAKVEANIPAADLDRAKTFYADKLGLRPSSEPFQGYLRYETAGGTVFNIYQTQYAGTAGHTIAQMHVDDVEKEAADLRARGVVFEIYEDMPGVEWRGDVAVIPEIGKAAWFKDSEGNILCIDEPASRG